MGAYYLGQIPKQHGQVCALAALADSWTVSVVGTGLLGCKVTSTAVGSRARIVVWAEEWMACGSRLAGAGRQAVPDGVRSEVAEAAGGLGIRKTGSLACCCGIGSRCCTQVEVDAGVVAEAVASKTVEVAASCGLLAEEHIAVAAAGTEAGIGAGAACESS